MCRCTVFVGDGPHLLVAQVSQVEGDPGQLEALTDIEHRDGVASIQQLLHQVSAQKSGPSDHSAPFITLNHTHTHARTLCYLHT